MKIFHGTENANILRPTVLTLGVFDGLHLGHQKIMRTVVERAAATGSAGNGDHIRSTSACRASSEFGSAAFANS